MAIEYLEWGTTQGSMTASVVPKLHKREPLNPLRWAGMNKATEERLQALINSFCLAIGLWMVGSTQLEGYIVELKQLFPESTDEYFITVSHYCRG